MAETKPSRAASARRRASRAAEKARRAKEKVPLQKLNKQTHGFVEFIRNKGIVGLAIGLAIGSVASGAVTNIVQGFINPIVQFLVGSNDRLEAAHWTLHLWGRTADFKWGAALSSLITLVATVFVIYLIFRIAKLDQLEKSDAGPLKVPASKPSTKSEAK